jgi:hypothetical protein
VPGGLDHADTGELYAGDELTGYGLTLDAVGRAVARTENRASFEYPADEANTAI